MKGISVIICCYNSATRLPETLRHLFAQNVAPELSWEIILVDNASKDLTTQVALDFYTKNIDSKKLGFKVLHEKKAGKTYALQSGFDEASYDYIVICDDDNWLSENYISTAFKIMEEKPETGIAGGFCYPVFGAEKPSWIDPYIGGYACEHNAQDSHYFHTVFGAGMVMRKAVIDQLSALKFNSLVSARRGKVMTTGEDAEHCKLYMMAGYKIWYDNELQLKHFIPREKLNWEYCKKLFASFGLSNVLLQLYDKASAPDAPEKLPYFFWLKNFLYYALVPIKYYYKYRPLLKKDVDEGIAITYLGWKLQRNEYWRLKNKLNTYYKDILRLKKNLQQH